VSCRITERQKDVLREAYSICNEISSSAHGQLMESAIRSRNALSGVIVSVDSAKPSISQADATSLDDAANVVASLLSGNDIPHEVQAKAKAVYNTICELKKDLEVKSE
jgi:hypothetical protein